VTSGIADTVIAVIMQLLQHGLQQLVGDAYWLWPTSR